MHYYHATIEYDGNDFAGFQWQKDCPTIQSEINRALGHLVVGKFSTMGASRTDTGVHALDQHVKLTLENEIECAVFLAKLNQELHPQIRCLTLLPCLGSFNPGADSRSKEYRYFFTNEAIASQEQRKFIATIANPLNMDDVRACVNLILGKHDFSNFCSVGSNVKSTIRTITACEVSAVDPRKELAVSSLFAIPNELNLCFQLRIEASGFLKQMIRHLISALWMVGSGKMTVMEFEKLLNGPKVHKQMWRMATPSGLYLWQIHYQSQ